MCYVTEGERTTSSSVTLEESLDAIGEGVKNLTAFLPPPCLLARHESDGIIPRAMPGDSPIKAFLCAMVGDTQPIVQLINRLQPELLCFFAPESSRTIIEQDIQPHLSQLPRRWDWVLTSDPHDLLASHRTLAQQLPPILQAWEIQAGELVLGLGDATPAMAGALTLVGMEKSAKFIQVMGRGTEGSSGATPGGSEASCQVVQGNLWDDAAATTRREASQLFNQGEYHGATSVFRGLESRVSGGQKPLYHAMAAVAEGYGLWSRLQHRQAWDKLKMATKSLEMSLLWGGPPGLKPLLPVLKGHVGFLERIALDPQEVKELLTLDLLGHAARLLTVQRDPEVAVRAVLRALENAAQWQLYKRYRIKAWDVMVDQLPERMREVCRTRYVNDIDGKYVLPLQAQFQVLAEQGDDIGAVFLAQWPKLKPLLDAADRAVLGHGSDSLKPERAQQLRETVLKIVGVGEHAWPVFPVLEF